MTPIWALSVLTAICASTFSTTRSLRKALADGGDRTPAQASVDYWFPRVAAPFGRTASDHFDAYRKYGLRERSNEELLAHWQDDVAGILGDLELAVPYSIAR